MYKLFGLLGKFTFYTAVAGLFHTAVKLMHQIKCEDKKGDKEEGGVGGVESGGVGFVLNSRRTAGAASTLQGLQ